jgi:uncharacterized protein YidB (DUF937 family)
MSNGMPSMTALLGMLALAGYQNRDKISELLNGATGSGATLGSAQASSLGGLLGSIGGMLGGGGAGGLLGGGLGELLQRNKEVSPPELKQAIGPDVLAALEKQTGLSQEELLTRLSRELPSAVDKYTPEGRIPN